MQIRRVTALFAMCALALAACSNSDDEASLDASDEAEQPSAEAEVDEPADTPADLETEVEAEAEEPATPAEFNADAAVFFDQFTSIGPGSHRIDTIGTPFSFDFDAALFVGPNSYGQFVLADPESRGPTDRDLVVMRLTDLVDPADLDTPLELPGPGWPASDFRGWVDSLDPGLVVSPIESTMIGNRVASTAELQFGKLSCEADTICYLGRNKFLNGQDLVTDVRYRIWVLDEGDTDPIYLIAAVKRAEDEAWLDTASQIVETIAFGEDQPNVVALEPPGPVTMPFLGGITAELSSELFVIDDVFGRVANRTEPGVEAEFLLNPRTAENKLLESTDDLISHLETNGAVINEIESTVIDGIDARVFDLGIDANGTGPIIMPRAEGGGWAVPPQARLWAIEHPDRGLLMITAEAFWEPDTNFPIILEQTEPIIESLEFVDLG